MLSKEIRKIFKFYFNTKCGQCCLLALILTLFIAGKSHLKPESENSLKVEFREVRGDRSDSPIQPQAQTLYSDSSVSIEVNEVELEDGRDDFDGDQLKSSKKQKFLSDEEKEAKKKKLLKGRKLAKENPYRPIIKKTIDYIENWVESKHNPSMSEKYNYIKGELMFWNRVASQWASNASVNYRVDMGLREDNPWPEQEQVKREMFEVEQVVEQCGCSRTILSTEPKVDMEQWFNTSTCSRHSVYRGQYQKTIGFSFYGNPNSTKSKQRKYFQGIKENLDLVPEFYPGWNLRVYYDLDENDPLLQDLCNVACNNPNIDICYVKTIPAAGDLHKVFAMNWRFLPLLDPQVDHYVSRDLDSRLNKREAAAVAEWLASDKAFHFMRDHPAHAIEILGSAWGVRMSDLERQYAKEAFLVGAKDHFMFWAPRGAYGPDQGFLKRYIWPWAKWNAISHDSYTCQTFPRTKPFPVQRIIERNNFVASVVEAKDVLRHECPEKCRPEGHKDWIHC